MFGRHARLRRRRDHLARALAADGFTRLGWADWLEAARTVEDLHASCPDPGWLVYCAYFEEVRQDKLLAGVLAVAQLAATHDPHPLVGLTEVASWPEQSHPDLIARVVAIEGRYPIARSLLDLLATPTTWALADLSSTRAAAAIERGPVAPLERSPFREDPEAATRETAEGLVAAGFAAAMLCVPLRHDGVREALTTHAAAAAALLAGSYPSYVDDALAAARAAYGWTRALDRRGRGG